jgi:hypothetical protein
MAMTGSYGAVTHNHNDRTICNIQHNWTSHASTGNVASTAAEAATAGLPYIRGGEFVGIVLSPGATAPNDNYEVTLLDDDGRDLLSWDGTGHGTDLGSNTAVTQYIPTIPIPFYGYPRIQVTNAGNSKIGNVVIYYRRGD